MSSDEKVGITPETIIAIALSAGYEQRRDKVSSTLFFQESNPADPDVPAILINIYYTTRSIMTLLCHPGGAGKNELWRSNAYDTLFELQDLFEKPRMHTGKGYRNAQKAVRGCVGCGLMKTRGEFSKNQWAKGPDGNRCTECLPSGAVSVKSESEAAEDKSGPWGATPDELISGMENMNLQDDDSNFPTLTKDLLQIHEKKSNKKGKGGGNNNLHNTKLVRRQFNCPDCPQHGRGSFIFFKKVPPLKPICKCPRCKKASGGKCKRLYPLPKEEEKGYGLYKCTGCGDKWGSSRAVANIGQECFSCAKKGTSVFVTPFRLEKHRKKMDGGRGMMRVPREPIGEDEADERGYGDVDRIRNESGGDVGGGIGGEQAFSYEPREQVFDADSISSKGSTGNYLPVGASPNVPSGYKHKCAGCATGKCKNKKVPFSKVHDVSDGNTISTRASVVTDSSIDKTDFFDRDEDFSGFED